MAPCSERADASWIWNPPAAAAEGAAGVAAGAAAGAAGGVAGAGAGGAAATWASDAAGAVIWSASAWRRSKTGQPPEVGSRGRVIRLLPATRNTDMEKQAYVDRAVGALVLRVDGGQRLQMAITASEVPDAAAMREGDGVVAIRAEAAGSRWPAGSHQLHFRNEHDPGDSVYLANALVPENDEVMVTAQHRDADQRALTIAFAVAPATEGSSQWPWFAGGAFGCAWLLRRIGGHRRLHA